MKRIWTIIIVLFFIGQLKAQDDFKPSFHIGVHYGANFGNVSFEPSILASPISLQNYGLMFLYEREPGLGLQLEVNFSQKGWQADADPSISLMRKMDYLELPFLTHISIGKKFFRFHINMGPYIAFYRDSYEELEVINNVEVDSLQSDIYQALVYLNEYGTSPKNDFDFGFMGGIGFGIYSRYGELTLRIRYSQGLTNLFPQHPDGNFRFSQFQTMYVGASYAVIIKRKKFAR